MVLGNADIFVLPSLTEGLPVSLIEAMAHAKAIVATHVGGIPEIIEDGDNGLLVAPKDPEGLAMSINRMIENPIERRRFAARSRQCFEAGRYDEDSVTADLLSVYEHAFLEAEQLKPDINVNRLR